MVCLVTVGTGRTCNGAQYQYNGRTVKVLPVMEISPVAFGTGSCNHVAYLLDSFSRIENTSAYDSMLLEKKKTSI